MAKAVGIDLGTTNSVVAVLEAGDPSSSPTPRAPHDARRSSRSRRPARCSSARSPSARRSPTPTARSARSSATWAPTGRSTSTARRTRRRRSAPGSCMKLKRDAEAYLGEHGHPGRHHRARVLRRRPAPGHQGGRRDRGPRSAAHHQRAHRGRARVRARQGRQRPDDPRVRPRRRHVRRVGARDRRRRLRGQGDRRQHAPRRRRLGPARHRLARHRVQERARRRPRATTRWPSQRLKEAAEKAKIELSNVQETNDQPAVHHRDRRRPAAPRRARSRGPSSRSSPPTCSRRAEARSSRRSRTPGSTRSKIDHVILVGGCTRMPAVADLVHELTGKDAHKGVNPDEVGRGRRVDPGRRAEGRRQGHPAPRRHAAVARHRDQGSDHDQAHRAQHARSRRSRRRSFTTADDNQPSVEIKVLQGESDMAYRNKPLGTFTLTGLPPAPRGVPQIEVTFDIDANGIVHVSAKDLGTGKEQSMVISGGTALGKDDINQMIKDAEAHAEEDQRKREEAEVAQHRRLARLPDRDAAQGAGRQGPGRRPHEDRGRLEGVEGRPRRPRRRGGQAGARER